ncbi:Fimbrial protein [BD1-7 clade bacterium]|uniref:Fimbrial protein n=1 Tax=BD1-7 clade bacterium TaxID=2029982 RepID=A0A5S9PV55_9GAMM|nr:Fimbrial protein [BD1-7 clade bacterium]CAA0108724.1 Fimbrial protein [BD1-7 clade bacterium]
MKGSETGFTLIELMVVVAIAGILSTLAYSSYESSVREGYYKSAQGELISLAMALEDARQRKNVYYKINGETAAFSDQAPDSGFFPEDNAKNYKLRLVDVGATHFVIRANPIAGTTVAETGFYELHSSGQKGWDRNKNGNIDVDEQCWKAKCN